MAIDDGWFQAAREIREQRYSDAKNTLEGVLQINPDLAKVHGKLGAVYAALGQKDLAIEHLETVTRLDPDDGYGETMLAWMAWLEGRYQDAIDHYQKADEIEPYQAKIHFQWGQALAKLQSWPLAEERLRQAVTIDPNHLDACLSLSQVMKAQNRLDEATRYASQAATITRQQNPDVLLYLAQCQTEAGQLAEARLTASKAEALARTTRPELLLRIQVLVDDIRIREQKQK
jgi:tetratricopeptide (TPR) repeat protein